MRICYIANAISIHPLKMARFFAQKGHEVHFISFESPLRDEPGITFHVISANKQFLWLTIFFKVISFKKIIRSIQPDIIHAHYLTKYGIFAWLTGFHPNVVSVMGSDILIDARGIKKIFSKCVLMDTNCIHCDGKNTFDEILSFGIDPEKIKLVYYGVDIRIFKPASPNEPIKNSKKITIISTRKLEKMYDIGSLIDAIPLIKKYTNNFVVIIIGEGYQKDILQRKVNSLGISEFVKFCGFVPNDELPSYLSSADIYVSTSLSDAGIAVSTAEAMSCGLPVVITDNADNAEWIVDGYNGYIIPRQSPKILADKVISLIQNQENREIFGIRNQKIIEANYNYYYEMEKIAKIYNALTRE